MFLFIVWYLAECLQDNVDNYESLIWGHISRKLNYSLLCFSNVARHYYKTYPSNILDVIPLRYYVESS